MNMRKIIALLAAVLMLCAAIPMGTLSVTAAAVSMDFEDGSTGGWNSDCGVDVVDDNGNQVLKWDASLADWANMFNYCNLSANTDYVLTLKVKADRNTNMNFKVLQGDWTTVVFQHTFDVTTEWQEVTVEFNYGDGAFVMLSSNTVKADGATYYVDDFSIEEYVEPVEPGTVINGDFETGDLSGWASHQSTTISTDAHSGSYAANIKGDGGWNGMLNQDVPVEAGKTYKVSVWYKVNSNGTNIQVKDGGTEGAKLASNWVTAATWTEQTWEVIPTTDTICINFCGGGNGIAEDVLIDDITVTAKVYGQVINGDFENGSEGWNLSSSASVVDGALQLTNPGQWSEALTQVVDVEPNTNYEITWMSKRISGSGAFNLIPCQSVAPWANFTRVAGQNWMNETSGNWVANSYTVNSGDNTSMLLKLTTEAVNPGEILLDNFVVSKVIEASNDGFIKNGDFETGKAAPEWTVYSGSNVSADAAKNGSYGLHCTNPSGGWGGTAFQDFTVEVGKSYEVTMWAKAIAQGQNIQIQNPAGGANAASTWFTKTDWTLLTFEFTATADTVRINICGGGTNGNEEIYVDDIKVVELIDPSFDGYIYNGDFETGEVFPWNNLWGSCPTVEIVEGGMDSNYALNVVSKKWCHVRQTAIAVEPNTWYKVTAWAKNTSDMILLVKDGGDSANLNQTGMTAGDEWTEFTGYFNSGDYTTVIVSLMGGENDEIAEKYGTFDNISMEVTGEPGCEQGYHKYFYACDAYCMNCGEETNPDAAHVIEHVEAKAAVSCIEYGNKEYWHCTACGTAWLDEALIRQTNMMSVRVAGECVSDAEYACQDGVCVNCGLPYAADAEHEYDDEYDADCNVCGEVREVPEKPVEIIYGDANSDGIVDILDEALLAQYNAGWEVTLDEVAADANGDGIVDILDEALLAQYNAGWDVTLGLVG